MTIILNSLSSEQLTSFHLVHFLGFCPLFCCLEHIFLLLILPICSYILGRSTVCSGLEFRDGFI